MESACYTCAADHHKTVRGGTMIVQVERYVNEVLSSYEHGRERIGVLVGRVTPKKR
jgi:hypothetical protein